MINFKANGSSYSYPEGLHEVTLGRFIDYCEFEKAERPQKLKELSKLREELSKIHEEDKTLIERTQEKIEDVIKEINSPEYLDTLLIWYAKVVEFWTGLNKAEILGEDDGFGMNINQLFLLSDKLLQLVNSLPEYEYSPVIEHEGEIWYLYAKYMKDSTVLPYLESSQFYKLEDQLAGGQWGALAKVLCLLLRKEGEKYSKDLLKREEYFLKFPMSKAAQVAFFFLKRTKNYSILLNTYTAAQLNSKMRREGIS